MITKEEKYPTSGQMVDMVNNDLLPFIDELEPNETEHFWVETSAVASLEGEDGKVFSFRKTDGAVLGVWKEYFLNPEEWKKNRVKKKAGQVY